MRGIIRTVLASLIMVEISGELPYTGRGGRVEAAKFRRHMDEMEQVRASSRDEMTSG